MELLLQKVDCRVTIPYYDFTMDAGTVPCIFFQCTNYSPVVGTYPNMLKTNRDTATVFQKNRRFPPEFIFSP